MESHEIGLLICEAAVRGVKPYTICPEVKADNVYDQMRLVQALLAKYGVHPKTMGVLGVLVDFGP